MKISLVSVRINTLCHKSFTSHDKNKVAVQHTFTSFTSALIRGEEGEMSIHLGTLTGIISQKQ